MKKTILVISVSINLILLILLGLFIHLNGGIPYLKARIGLKSSLKPGWYFRNNSYWEGRRTLFEVLNDSPDEIIFLGNSLTDRCEWSELLNNPAIKNRGIDGDNTEGILERLPDIVKSQPRKIFIEIGINDLGIKSNTFEISKNYKLILERIRSSSPNTKIYLQSVFPVSKKNAIRQDSIVVLNQRIKNLSDDCYITFINLFDSFLDSKGYLNTLFSYDNSHLNGRGYLLWKDLIKKYVNDD